MATATRQVQKQGLKLVQKQAEEKYGSTAQYYEELIIIVHGSKGSVYPGGKQLVRRHMWRK